VRCNWVIYLIFIKGKNFNEQKVEDEKLDKKLQGIVVKLEKEIDAQRKLLKGKQENLQKT
jgi:hypothetical protein